MRVIIVHNMYRQSGSGENIVVLKQYNRLLDEGNYVELFSVHSSDFHEKKLSRKRILFFLDSLAGVFSSISLLRLIKNFSPDQIIIHNMYPRISPLVLLFLLKFDVVIHLHNFRLWCASGSWFRHGSRCFSCRSKIFSYSSFRHRCYRSSLLLTFHNRFYHLTLLYVLRLAKSIKINILNDFHRTLLREVGIEDARIKLFSNKIFFSLTEQPSLIRTANYPSSKYFIVLGRVSQEKGCHWLIQVLSNSEFEVRFVGQIDDAIDTAGVGFNIKFLGEVPRDEALNELSRASGLILGPGAVEGFPNVIYEAQSCGVSIFFPKLVPFEEALLEEVNCFGYDVDNPDTLFKHLMRF